MSNSRQYILNDSKAFNKYSNDMDDIHKNIKGYNPNKSKNY